MAQLSISEQNVAQDLIRHAQTGQAACHYFKARWLVAIYRRWRRSDSYRLFGVMSLRDKP
jgi:hypothetical protein